MSKSKWSVDFRIKVAQEYLDGKGSFYYLADKYHIGRATIQKWVATYKVHGIDAFIYGPGNASYTSELNKKISLSHFLPMTYGYCEKMLKCGEYLL